MLKIVVKLITTITSFIFKSYIFHFYILLPSKDTEDGAHHNAIAYITNTIMK